MTSHTSYSGMDTNQRSLLNRGGFHRDHRVCGATADQHHKHENCHILGQKNALATLQSKSNYADCYRPLWLLCPLAFLVWLCELPCANVCELVVIALPLAWGEEVPAETKAGVAEDRMRAGCMEPLAGIPGRGLITQKTMLESFQSRLEEVNSCGP